MFLKLHSQFQLSREKKQRLMKQNIPNKSETFKVRSLMNTKENQIWNEFISNKVQKEKSYIKNKM